MACVGLAVALLTTAGCGPAAVPPPEPPPCSLLLITIDTLRADHLSATGHLDRLTPHLDQMARRGILAPAVVTPANTTLPAHASLLTSLPPEGHGGFGNGRAIRGDIDSLARSCRKHGMATAAMVSSWVVGPGWNLEQGFEAYIPVYKTERRSAPPPSPSHRPCRAEDITRAACRWLEQHRDRPFMLWLHYMDPHQPYTPPPPYGASAMPPETAGRPTHPNDFVTLFREQRQLPPPVLHAVRRDYAGEVAYTDRCIGGVLSTLARLGLDQSTLVVAVADHGEALSETRCYFGHTLSLAETVNRVPLIFAGPGLRRGLLLRPATLLDVAPTILALLDLDVPEAFVGRDLSPLVRAGTAENSGMAMGSDPLLFTRGEDGRRAWLVEDMKATFDPEGRMTSLHDLAADPLEHRDLLAEAPALAEELRRRYMTPHTELARLAAELPQAHQVPGTDEETAIRLRELGYVEE